MRAFVAGTVVALGVLVCEAGEIEGTLNVGEPVHETRVTVFRLANDAKPSAPGPWR